MLKIEYVWRELLYRSIEESRPDFTITELAKIFNLSTSVVSHALFPLKELGIVIIKKKVSKVIDTERLLFFWATRRNFKKDIIYSTFSPLPVYDREGLMPSDVVPTAFTAFRYLLNKTPADYDHIYFYSTKIEKISKRFPISKRPQNIFILKSDPYLLKSKKLGLAQLFVDLWNLPEWYAKDFTDAVLLEIRRKLNS
jgi:DNA-binding transcriptional ArsR family regulator